MDYKTGKVYIVIVFWTGNWVVWHNNLNKDQTQQLQWGREIECKLQRTVHSGLHIPLLFIVRDLFLMTAFSALISEILTILHWLHSISEATTWAGSLEQVYSKNNTLVGCCGWLMLVQQRQRCPVSGRWFTEYICIGSKLEWCQWGVTDSSTGPKSQISNL